MSEYAIDRASIGTAGGRDYANKCSVSGCDALKFGHLEICIKCYRKQAGDINLTRSETKRRKSRRPRSAKK